MIYEYENVTPGENQYEEFDFENTNYVPARYIKSKISCDNGNILIEALPPPRTGDRMKDYARPVPGFFSDDIQAMEEYEKLLAIRLLRHYRCPLPFHDELELNFHMMLVESYRNRKYRFLPYGSVTITKENQDINSEIMVQGKIASSANAGCSLIGYSGCGKSSALEILLSNYPQVIEHVTEREARLTQIVYLVIVCPTNSNFSALYTEIGAAIDRALGNTAKIYEKRVSSYKTLPSKANYICELIETFAIGCIIFDEIQLIDFQGHKENTFESLLKIVNQTKVAMLTVGTEDALEKMYPNLRTARRAGPLIEASKYCTNKMFFECILKDLLSYKWIKKKISLTKEILDTFYEVTGGIIDQLIGIYMFMQIDYLSSPPQNAFKPMHIRKTAQKHYPGMQELLKNINDPQAERARQELIQKANFELDTIIQNEQQNHAMQRIMSSETDSSKRDKLVLRDKLISNIKNTVAITEEHFDQKEIEHAVDAVLRKQESESKTEKDLSTTAYRLLKKRKESNHLPSRTQSKVPKTKAEISAQDLLTSITRISPLGEETPP